MIYLGSTPEILARAILSARRGEAARILEPSPRLGGWAACDEAWPEVCIALEAHHAGGLSQRLIDDLALVEKHGLAFLDPPALAHAPAPDDEAPSLTIWNQMERTVEEIRRHSPQDASRWPDFCRSMRTHASLLEELLQLDLAAILRQGLETFGPAGEAAGGQDGRKGHGTAEQGGSSPAAPQMVKSLLFSSSWSELAPALSFATRLRRQGGPEMMEFLRVLPMTFKELMDEWFETPLLRGLLGTSAVLDSHLGPQAAGTTLNFLYHLIGSPDGQYRDVRRIRGGLPALMQTLESAARSDGVEIVLNADVRLHFEDGHSVPSEKLKSVGEVVKPPASSSSGGPSRDFRAAQRYSASRQNPGAAGTRSSNGWTSAFTPHYTHLRLLPPSDMTPALLRRLRPRGARPVTTYLHVLLKDSAPPPDAQTGHILHAPSLEYIERASDAAKYGRTSEHLVIDAFRSHDQVLSLRLQYTDPGHSLSDLTSQALQAFPLDPSQVQSTTAHPSHPIYSQRSLELDQLVQRAFESSRQRLITRVAELRSRGN